MDARFTPSERDFYYLQHLEQQREALDFQTIAIQQAVASLFSGTPPTYFSKKLHAQKHSAAKINREFPYDAIYLSKQSLNHLVNLSKSHGLTQYGLYRLKTLIPADIAEQLRSLKEKKFFEEEFWSQVDRLIGYRLRTEYQEQIAQVATTFAGRLRHPEWTLKRAQAHLQEDDPIAKRMSVTRLLWGIYEDYERRGIVMTEKDAKRWVKIERLQDVMTPPPHVQHIAAQRGMRPDEYWRGVLEERRLSLAALRKEHIDLLKQAQSEMG